MFRKTVKTLLAAVTLLAASQMAFAELSNADGSRKTEFKGRNSIYVTADTNMDHLVFDSTFDASSIAINNLDACFTFGLGKILFIGATGGVQFDTLESDNRLYEAGMVAGASVDMAIIRPYVMGTAVYGWDQSAILKIGGGLDIPLGILMLNVGYNYNYKYDISGVITNYQTNNGTSLKDDIAALTATNYHSFNVGIGITW